MISASSPALCELRHCVAGIATPLGQREKRSHADSPPARRNPRGVRGSERWSQPGSNRRPPACKFSWGTSIPDEYGDIPTSEDTQIGLSGATWEHNVEQSTTVVVESQTPGD